MDACDTIAKQVCKVEACREGKLLKPGLKEPDCIVKEMLSYYRTHAPSAQSAATIPPVNVSPLWSLKGPNSALCSWLLVDLCCKIPALLCWQHQRASMLQHKIATNAVFHYFFENTLFVYNKNLASALITHTSEENSLKKVGSLACIEDMAISQHNHPAQS
jgi:hypothetical protein